MLVVASRKFADLDQLEKLVIHLATLYDLGDDCVDFDGVPVSDPEYDELYKTLKQKRPESEAFTGTTPSKAKAKGDTVTHDPPMTSISKADGDDKETIYQKWLDSVESGEEVVKSFKHDGVALRVNYVKGKLVSAGLRPRDGVEGTDVTVMMPYVKGVPAKLVLPLTLSLNGEVECHKPVFEKINAARDAEGEEPYKNPRNYTAGCMGRDDPEEIKDAGLSVAFYSITGFDNWHKHYHTEIERAKWANQKHGLALGGAFVRMELHEPGKIDELLEMEKLAPTLDYEVDGIVLKVNDLDAQEQMGHEGDDPVKPPKGAIAWKFAEKTAQATIGEMEWNASRTGRVVPTAIFEESVDLADTEVSRATCNNVGWARARGIGVGAVIEVKKGGKIIPNVVRVIEPVKNFQAPTHCPTCGSKLVEETSSSGNSDLFCRDPDCGAKQVRAWVFFFQNIGAKGLGGSAMEKILAAGKVRELSDFFELTVDELIDAGFSERQAILALATIWLVKPVKDNEKLVAAIKKAQAAKIKVQGWKFFAGLGIPGAGKTVGKVLVDHYRAFEPILEATEDDLLELDGIGEITAKAISRWIDGHGTMVSHLLTYFDLEMPKTGKLTGKTFVLTGGFEGGKKQWQDRIEALGGKAGSSVGSKTTYLVAGDNVGKTKTDAAKKNKVPIISVEELEKML